MNPVISTAMLMPTVIWGANGFHMLDLMLLQCRFDSQSVVEHVMLRWFRQFAHEGGLGILPA
jgi:hypothetical protein